MANVYTVTVSSGVEITKCEVEAKNPQEAAAVGKERAYWREDWKNGEAKVEDVVLKSVGGECDRCGTC